MPHTITCALLGVSLSWYYKWISRAPTARQQRREALDAAVRERFEASGGTYGSPCVHADLREADWRVSVNTVAVSMRRQELVARKVKRYKGLTRQDRSAPKVSDLVRRDFTASAPNQKWCGDMTQIPTGECPLYLATVIDLYSRRLLACSVSEHPDAALAADAIKIAATVRGGREHIAGVIFHTDRGSVYTSTRFALLCKEKLDIRQSMGRVGSCFDNAAAESFFATLEHELLSRYRFTIRNEAKTVITTWCHQFYNNKRRHSSAGLLAPTEYEKTTPDQPAAA
ncbi:IS3 family transposase [Sciscionella marina]|uniref:IS3 family transposase n=1 Tax=Sciscionella marina TaxID=508770 RepID=UPI0003672AFC|nr:IS3 family transposase [Sciscionella marina]